MKPAPSYAKLSPERDRSLCLFSRLTLRGAHLPSPITLSRRESFPARQFDFKTDQLVNRSDWHAAEPPQNTGQLSLELGEYWRWQICCRLFSESYPRCISRRRLL
ncbi:hypothetical protein DAEQUDRAFT_117841 [Daedalea quercina L-15889]|uniref:Uncharacterized protein n=1 Tax=Daedalea quercina L-15889 TaxID=1314783 RepID=A0A165KSP0_9APHY|nr:hypothetical protein DAEQUDRAFT_117841 [Daedalea quercina L-15889]